MISKEISYKSYKEICSGEKKKINLGYLGNWKNIWEVEKNSIVHIPRKPNDYIHGKSSNMPLDWEVLSKFFSNNNAEPELVDCENTYGWYDKQMGEWTGCVGKV